MQPLISQPSDAPVDTLQSQPGGIYILGAVNQGWRAFFVAIYNILSNITLSGTTAQRPTVFTWIGMPFFDTTLGRPVWLKVKGSWVFSDGTPA